jgi:hypothetical protein
MKRKVDLPKDLPPVMNRGNTGAATGIAMASMLYAIEKKHVKEKESKGTGSTT